MNRRLTSLLICGASAIALSGCATAGSEVARDPATIVTAAPVADGDQPESDSGPGLPPAQWPATGCDARAVTSVGYRNAPPGFATPEEAIGQSTAGNIPDGDVVAAPDPGKGPARFWVVDPDTGEVQAEVSVTRGPTGWYVDGVVTCA